MVKTKSEKKEPIRYTSKFSAEEQRRPYIILQSLEHGNRFIKKNDIGKPEHEKIKLQSGQVAFKVIGYAKNIGHGEEKLVTIRTEASDNLKVIDKREYSEMKEFVDSVTTETAVNAVKFYEMVGILKEILD